MCVVLKEQFFFYLLTIFKKVEFVKFISAIMSFDFCCRPWVGLDSADCDDIRLIGRMNEWLAFRVSSVCVYIFIVVFVICWYVSWFVQKKRISFGKSRERNFTSLSRTQSFITAEI